MLVLGCILCGLAGTNLVLNQLKSSDTTIVVHSAVSTRLFFTILLGAKTLEPVCRAVTISQIVLVVFRRFSALLILFAPSGFQMRFRF